MFFFFKQQNAVKPEIVNRETTKHHNKKQWKCETVHVLKSRNVENKSYVPGHVGNKNVLGAIMSNEVIHLNGVHFPDYFKKYELCSVN